MTVANRHRSSIFENLKQLLLNGNRHAQKFELLHGFGVFNVRELGARAAFNPSFVSLYKVSEG